MGMTPAPVAPYAGTSGQCRWVETTCCTGARMIVPHHMRTWRRFVRPPSICLLGFLAFATCTPLTARDSPERVDPEGFILQESEEMGLADFLLYSTRHTQLWHHFKVGRGRSVAVYNVEYC